MAACWLGLLFGLGSEKISRLSAEAATCARGAWTPGWGAVGLGLVAGAMEATGAFWIGGLSCASEL